MKTITASMLLGLALTAASGPGPAQESENHEQARADRAALRAQLEQAREELAEAARRMAEIQRQLVTPEDGFAFAWKFDQEGKQGEPIDIEQLRMFANGALENLKLWPPRLGVLLAGEGGADPRTVVGLTPGSGAEKAGIERGDVLVAVDGEPIGPDEVERIQSILSEREPGDTVAVEVLRDGERRTFEVKTSSSLSEDIRVIVKRVESLEGPDGEFNFDFTMPPLPPIPEFAPHLSALGSDADLVANHEGLQRYFGTADGVLVVRIGDDNAFGLRDGDVILTVNREPVGSPVDLGRRLMAHDPGTEVAIEVMRDGVLTELTGTMPKRPSRDARTGRIRMRAPASPPKPPPPPQPAEHTRTLL